MPQFHAISCAVQGEVLLEHIPLTCDCIPDAPLSEMRLVLDLSAHPEPDEVSALMQLVMRNRDLVTWMLMDATSPEPFPCQGYLTRVVFPTTADGRTTMTIDMHVFQAEVPPTPEEG